MARKIDNRQSENRLGTQAEIIDAKGEITLAGLDSVSGGTSQVVGTLNKVETTLNIGSQSTGSGAGKVVFNPF